MQPRSIVKKGLSLGIVLMLIVTAIIPLNGQRIDKKSLPASRGNTLYVGGSGPGNYTKIQDAIDNASENDTIIVFSGIYYENLIIQKTLYLQGVNSSYGLPIIDGNESADCILIQAPRVIIDRFITQNAGSWLDGDRAGIQVSGRNCTIQNCICKGVSYNGIYIDMTYTANFCKILNNTINGTLQGIYASGDIRFLNISGNNITNCNDPLECHGAPFNTTIYNNILTKNSQGMKILYGTNVTIIGNKIYDNGANGIIIFLNYGSKTIIKSNIIIRNGGGIFLNRNYCDINVSYNIISLNSAYSGIRVYDTEFSYRVDIYKNQIEQNYPLGIRFELIFHESMARSNNIINNSVWFRTSPQATFDSNYWGRTLDHPKIIFGFQGIFLYIPWIKFDRHPAQEPFIIPGMR